MTELTPQSLGSVITISKGRKHEITDSPSITSRRLIGIDDLRNDDLIRYTDDATGTEAIPDDVLIAWDGANAGTIGYGKNGYIGSTISRLRVKSGARLFTPFLGLYLKSKFDYLRQTSTGATIPHINRNALENVPLPAVEFDDQIRIAHLLSKVEGLIAQRKQHLQELDDLLKSVFLEMFGDPVKNEKRHKISTLTPYITHLTSGGRGWAEYYSSSGKRFIRSLDVQMNSIGSDDVAYVTPPNNKEAERTRVMPGDVLLTITGSKIGRVCCVPEDFEEGYISQHVAIIRTQGINPIYLSFYLSMPACGQRAIAKQQYGQAKPGLNLTQIQNFEIIDPDRNLQNQFAAIFEKIKGIKSRYQQSLADLEALYGALSQKAFKGKLDLSRVPLPTAPIEANTEITPALEGTPIQTSRIVLQPPSFPQPQTAIAEWLEAYCQQLGEGHAFVATDFVEAVNTQYLNKEIDPAIFGAAFPSSPWAEQEDEHGPDWAQNKDAPSPAWCDKDHEQLKQWVFDALAKGKLKQVFDATTNSITLVRATPAPVKSHTA